MICVGGVVYSEKGVLMYQYSPELPDDFDGVVRLFPLPEHVSFPNTIQPLHIFESRYREMLEDALETDHLIGMATLMPGYQADYYGRPPISSLVCIGRVASHERRDDGTYDLILVGFWRARVESEVVPVKSYRQAKVSVLPEEIVDVEGLKQCPQRDVVDRLAAEIPSAAELMEAFEQGRVTLNCLTDILAFHLPLSHELKLRLLGEIHPVKRALLLLENLHVADEDDVMADEEQWEGDASDGREFPPPFSDN